MTMNTFQPGHDPNANTAADIRARIDFTHWPVLMIRMPGLGQGSSAPVLTGMMDLALARGEPFVVVADMSEYVASPEESAQERKAAAQWLKANHQRFFALCRGNVYVLADAQARQAVLASGQKQAKASGMPVAAAASPEEALAIAQKLLAASEPMA